MTTLTIATTAYNERGNVAAFLSESLQAIEALSVDAEIVFIDDCSSDGTADEVETYINLHSLTNVRLIRHKRQQGITAAIQEISEIANGTFIAFLPSDMECSLVVDVPAMYHAMDDSTDIVAGWRKGRGDGKVFASTIYNWLNRLLFNVTLRDANWIKLIRKDRLKDLYLHSDWHRFLIPILVHQGARVKEVETQWHKRNYGSSKFNLGRFPVAISDLLSVKIDLVFGKRPLLLFGWVSFLSLILSLFFLAVSLFYSGGTIMWAISFIGFIISIIALLIGVGVDMILLRIPRK